MMMMSRMPAPGLFQQRNHCNGTRDKRPRRPRGVSGPERMGESRGMTRRGGRRDKEREMRGGWIAVAGLGWGRLERDGLLQSQIMVVFLKARRVHTALRALRCPFVCMLTLLLFWKPTCRPRVPRALVRATSRRTFCASAAVAAPCTARRRSAPPAATPVLASAAVSFFLKRGVGGKAGTERTLLENCDAFERVIPACVRAFVRAVAVFGRPLRACGTRSWIVHGGPFLFLFFFGGGRGVCVCQSPC